jgi:hypothetical protein
VAVKLKDLGKNLHERGNIYIVFKNINNGFSEQLLIKITSGGS